MALHDTSKKQKLLLIAEKPDEPLISQVREDIRYYDEFIGKGMNCHDSTGPVQND